MDSLTVAQMRERAEKDSERRRRVIELTRQEAAEAESRVQAAYDVNNVRAAIDERGQRDRNKPSEAMRKAAALESLRFILHEKEKKVAERLKKRAKMEKKVHKEEAWELLNYASELNKKLANIQAPDGEN